MHVIMHLSVFLTISSHCVDCVCCVFQRQLPYRGWISVCQSCGCFWCWMFLLSILCCIHDPAALLVLPFNWFSLLLLSAVWL